MICGVASDSMRALANYIECRLRLAGASKATTGNSFFSAVPLCEPLTGFSTLARSLARTLSVFVFACVSLPVNDNLAFFSSYSQHITFLFFIIIFFLLYFYFTFVCYSLLWYPYTHT